jgi:S1-C subfamily serine protease
MVKSSFLSVSARTLRVCGAVCALLPFTAAPVLAADPPAHAVLEVRKNSAGEETITHGVLIDSLPGGLIVTVAASVEDKATFLVGPHPPSGASGRQPTAATVVLFDPASRVLFLKTTPALAGVAAVKLAAAPTTITTSLAWSPAEGPQPAIDAGPLRQLDGRPLALTLRRLHFGSSRESDRPVPGTPVFTTTGELAALPLSPLPDETGAWLGLPAAAIAKLAADYAAVGRAETGQLDLGVAIGTTTPRIEFVKPGSRAQKAGLLQGDILLSLGGRPITDVFDVLDANFFLTAREPVTIRLLRGLETMSVTAPPVMPPK